MFFSKNFKYSEREQAERRTYRTGQEKNCVYIDLVCRDSLDEIIDSNISDKDYIASAFVDYVRKYKKNNKKVALN